MQVSGFTAISRVLGFVRDILIARYLGSGLLGDAFFSAFRFPNLFRRIFGEAERVKGDTGENLIGLLERRLDTVVYRAKFVATMFAARQFVNHGHVTVNGKRVNIPSYRVKEGDVVEVRDRSKQIAVLIEATQLAERDVPDYIDADHSKMKATFVRTPALGDVPFAVQMEPNLVVEFYSR